MRSLAATHSLYRVAMRPQGMDAATITGIAVAITALVAAFRSVKDLFDDDAKAAIKASLDDGNELERVDRTDPRLAEFFVGIAHVNKALKEEGNPIEIMRAVAQIERLADNAPACQVVISELRALEFRARTRCAALYGTQRAALEADLLSFLDASQAHVEHIEEHTSADPKARMAQTKQLDAAKMNAAKLRTQAEALLEDLESASDSQQQLAFTKARTLRRTLELARERERKAYDKLAVTKTTVRQPPQGSRSVSYAFWQKDEKQP